MTKLILTEGRSHFRSCEMQNVVHGKCHVSTLCTDPELGPGDGEENEAQGLPWGAQSPGEDNYTRVRVLQKPDDAL